MTKRDLLVLALERRTEFTDPHFAKQGTPGERTPIGVHDKRCALHSHGQVCTCWRRTYAELDRCLAIMCDLMPGPYSHLIGRYRLVVETRRQGVRIRRGVWQLEPNEAILKLTSNEAHLTRQQLRGLTKRFDEAVIVRWPTWVNLTEVERGLDWLEGAFVGEPYLPQEALTWVA